MAEIRFCLDCSIAGEMTQHGRCSCCGSNAVVAAESNHAWRPPRHEEVWEPQSPGEMTEIMELENLFSLVGK